MFFKRCVSFCGFGLLYLALVARMIAAIGKYNSPVASVELVEQEHQSENPKKTNKKQL